MYPKNILILSNNHSCQYPLLSNKTLYSQYLYYISKECFQMPSLIPDRNNIFDKYYIIYKDEDL